MSEKPIIQRPDKSGEIRRVYNEYSVMYSRLTVKLIEDLMRKDGLSYEDAEAKALALTVKGARDTAEYLAARRQRDEGGGA